jgi:two-component system response regulator HydG
MKLGADNFFIKPWDNDKLLQLINDTLTLKPILKTSFFNTETHEDFPSIIGKSAKLLKQLNIAKMVAASSANILITGENGTGKDVLAKEIHRLSIRNASPFVKVNIGGLTTSLFESELFGHEKGAYTDAKDARKGRFEEADQGTIFLDEIGDLPFEMQVKLLRVIQDGQFERLGSNKTLSVDLRIISATNANLAELIDTNQFREDLFYRLNTIEIHLPALRERGSDVLLLAQFFIDKFNKKYQKSFTLSNSNNDTLLNYSWPGNIRELEHCLERAVLTSQKELEFNLKKGSPKQFETDTLEAIEKKTILHSLAENNNNISHTAKQLGITRNALYRRIQKFEIDLE